MTPPKRYYVLCDRFGFVMERGEQDLAGHWARVSHNLYTKYRRVGLRVRYSGRETTRRKERS